MGSADFKKYSNPDKLYQVKLLRTDKSAGFFETLQKALARQKEFEYATIIRVDPKTREPLYGSDGWPMPV